MLPFCYIYNKCTPVPHQVPSKVTPPFYLVFLYPQGWVRVFSSTPRTSAGIFLYPKHRCERFPLPQSTGVGVFLYPKHGCRTVAECSSTVHQKNVVPIFKKEDGHEALKCIPCKILKHIFRIRILEHLEKVNFETEAQDRFRGEK